MREKLDAATKKLERAILEGRYMPGDRLPSERELAVDYGVSRSILREGIRRLVGLGLLRTEPQSGTYVTDYRKEASLDFLIYLLDNHESLDPEIFRAVNEFREILETGCAAKAAVLATPERSIALRAALENMRREESNPDTLAERDYEFHALFVEQTDNLALRIIFNACKSVYLFYVRAFYSDPENAPATFAQLETFLERLEARDPEGAAKALSVALLFGRERVYRILRIEQL